MDSGWASLWGRGLRPGQSTREQSTGRVWACPGLRVGPACTQGTEAVGRVTGCMWLRSWHQRALSRVCADERSPRWPREDRTRWEGAGTHGPRGALLAGGPGRSASPPLARSFSHGLCPQEGPTHDDVQSRRFCIVRTHCRKTHAVC